MAFLRRRLPLQEDLLQLANRQVGKMHSLLPAARDRSGPGLLPLLASAASVTSACCSTTPTGITEATSVDDKELVEAHRSIILDPHDEAVIEGARRNGLAESVIEAAQRSPVYNFVKVWKMALPAHPEFRTIPMLFYVPPLLPVTSSHEDGTTSTNSDDFFHAIDKARMPVEYLGSLLGAGNTGVVTYSLRKMMAVRYYRRGETVGDIDAETVDRVLREADCTREEAEAIYRLSTLATTKDRFVIPPSQREQAIEMMDDPLAHKQFGRIWLSPGSATGGMMSTSITSKRALFDAMSALFTYPQGDFVERLQACRTLVEQHSPDRGDMLAALTERSQGMNRGEIEEMFTRTFEINPVCALEVGWHVLR